MNVNGHKSLLHRLWRRMPRRARRSVLFHATSVAAPRPTSRARPALPIVVAGALRTASGLGQSARLCHDALKVAGERVFGLDLTSALMQPADHADFAFADGGAVLGPGTLILHVNSPLVPLAMWRLGRRFVGGKYIVGYWAWELPGVPADWRHGIPFVHEIWVPSRFTADAVRPIAAGRPVRVVPHPVALQGTLATRPEAPGDRAFTVLTIFNTASSFARKNPLAAISAFRRAFGDDPTTLMVIKTSHLSAYPEGSSLIENARGTADNIVVIDRNMSAAELAALYLKADVVMSLHRSEGFGLVLAEAMLRGLPVVATDWSGNVDFLTAETGVPIPYRLVPAADPQGTYDHPQMGWAEADVDEAAAALKRCRDDRALGATLGRAAARFAARTWTAEAYVGTVRRHLGL